MADRMDKKRPHGGSFGGHGGDVHRASRLTGIPVHEIIDFSASINPLGASPKALNAASDAMSGRNIGNYPPPHACELARRIERMLRAPEKGEAFSGRVIVGNGSTELIYLIPRAFRPKTVLIHGPTFSEYGRAALLSGARVRVSKSDPLNKGTGPFDLDRFLRDMRASGADMAFICNPNNPTGQLLGREAMARLAVEAAKARCRLVVDEAFMDFCPGQSLVVDAIKGKGNRKKTWLIVLRSMTKFHALTGFRIGYAVFGSASDAEKTLGCKEPWSVNTPAIEAAMAALDDTAHAQKTLRLMEREREYIGRRLTEEGIWHLPTAANFFLIKIKRPGGLIERLFRKGILVRDCSNFPGLGEGFIRIAIKKRRENRLLLDTIRDFLSRP